MSQLRSTFLALLTAVSLTSQQALAKQVTVTVGTGTKQSSLVPYGNYDKNSTNQMIYTKSELGSNAGPITSLAFDVAAKSSHATTSVQIYIGKSTTDSFSSTTDARNVSSMTLVYSGAPTLGTALGWEEFVLQTPFNYDGNSNLVIVVGRQATSYNGSLKYNCSSVSGKCLHRGSDTVAEMGDPTDTSNAYKASGDRPNIQLVIGEQQLVTIGNIIYRVKEGKAYVKGYTSALSGSATIASQVTSEGETYIVSSIAEAAFADCATLTNITIPSTINALPSQVFKGCSSLASITLSNEVSTIAASAFEGCSALSSLSIPASVTQIETDAFKGCSALKDIVISDSETTLTVGRTSVDGTNSYYYPGIFGDCPVEKVYLGRNLDYGTSALNYCAPFKSKTTLTELTIGPKVTTIGAYLFNGCSTLTTLTIPANVTKIEQYGLKSLSGLKELTIEDSEMSLDMTAPNNYYGMFSSIGIEKLYLGRDLTFCTDNYYNGAFYSCNSLAEVTIGKKVKAIADYAFYSCSKLKTVYNYSPYFTVTAGETDNGYVAYYADHALNGDAFAQTGDFLYYTKGSTNTIYSYIGTNPDVVVPAGYNIEDGLFYANETLTSITFSNGLKRISRACMERCTALTSVTIPNSVEEIDDYAFFGCSALTNITLPTGLKRLGGHTLQMCTGLTSLTIPSGVTTLEEFCLSRTGLTSITIPETVTRIEGGVFHWCRSLQTVNMSKNLTHIGPFAFKYCSELTEIEVPAGVDSIAVHAFYYCPKMTKVTLHEGLKSIGDFGFYASGITDINLPNTLTRIGQYGLAQNDFTHLTLPENLTQLETAALSGNSNLTAITIPSGITELSHRVLASCSKLNDITLPETLTKIGSMALYSTPMKQLKWPSHLKTIGYQALGGSYTYGAHVVPSTVSEVDCMLFYDVEDGNTYFCFNESVLPDNAFLGQTLLRSTLYVMPDLVEQYRASELGNRFKAILPIGDTNGDGELTVADMAEEICYMTENRPSDYAAKPLGAHDTNGDGQLTQDDIAALQQAILNPFAAASPVLLTSIANIHPIEIATEASENCQLLSSGGCLDWDGPAALDLINHLRWEACLEGVWKSGYTHLSMDDFHTYTWSTDLERIARIRVVESYYSRYHQRLNYGGWTSVSSNGLTSSSECLAFWSSFLGQMMSYYGEKNYWMLKTSGQVTGHYTSMISTGYKYIGMAGFEGTATLQFSANDKAGNETRFLEPTGHQKFLVDVRNEYITGYEWIGSYNGSRVTENFTMKDGEYISMWYAPIMQFVNQVSVNRGFYMRSPYMTYTSSNPEVAYYDLETGLVRGLKAGTTTITATDGEHTSEVDVSVTCNHDIEYSEPDAERKSTGTCSKCGETVEAQVPRYFYVWFWTGNSGSPSPNASYKVGENIRVSYSCYEGTDPYKYLLIDCDHPELLDVPYHAENSTNWTALGAGTVKLKVYLKYNPSVYQTYTINIVEPE